MLWHLPRSGRARHTATPSRRPRRSRPTLGSALEWLEDRTAPAVATWTGAGDATSWSDPNNWSREGKHEVAQTGDDVVIPDVAATTLIRFDGLLRYASLSSEEDIVLSAFGAALFLNGDLTLTRGIYLTGTQSQLGFGRFDATPSSMSVRGGGTVFLQNPSAQVVIDGNTTLTIEAGSTVSGIGRVGLTRFFDGTAVLVNRGTISGAGLTVTPDVFTNQGTVESTAGSGVQVVPSSPAAGNVSTGTFRAAGTNSYVDLGNVTLADGNSFRISGGAAISAEQINNAGHTQFLDTSGGTFHLTGVTGGAFTGPAGSMISADGSVADFTCDLDLLVGSVRVVGDLTLNRTAYLTSNGSTLAFGPSVGTAATSQALRGTGTVAIQHNVAQVAIDGNTTLTIDPGVTVRGVGSVGQPVAGRFGNDGTAVLVNRGTISGITMTVAPDVLTNQGTIEATGGFSTTVLPVPTNFSGGTLTGGTWRAAANSTLALFGVTGMVTNAAGIVLDGAGSQIPALSGLTTNAGAGTFAVLNGGSFTTAGTFTNAGTLTLGATSTFTVPFAANRYTQSGGSTVVNGTLTASTVDLQAGSLSGSGTVNGGVTNAGAISPGTSPGILTINGNYTGAANGALSVELNGATPGTGYDQLRVNGTVNLTGTLLTGSLGFASVAGNTYVIVDNDGTDPVTGTFTGLPEGAALTLAGQSFTVTYAGGTGNDVALIHRNTTPMLAPIGNRAVDEGSLLAFMATATDPDPQTLTFSLDPGAPAGAGIDPVTGAFTWTPTEAQGPGTFAVTVRVTDSGTPALSATETITVTVAEVNRAPTLAAIADRVVDEQTLLSFTAAAPDPDLPANALTFSLDPGAPAGAGIDPVTGVFTWTPTEAQGPNTFTLTVRVTDNGSPAMSTARTFNVTVNEVNTPPVLDPVPDQTVDEGSPLNFTLAAHDGDLPADTLTFGATGLPAGAVLNTTGAFAWTPTELQDGTYSFDVSVSDGGVTVSRPVHVTVREVNTAPVLTSPGNQAFDERAPLSLTLTASDADRVGGAPNALAYSFAAGAQPGMTLDPATGAFSWTPTETQDGTYTVTFEVTDNGTPSLADTRTITITVREVNQPPVLTPVVDQTINEGSLLTVTASATDPDLPANGLTFSLVNPPVGAAIDPTTGAFSWAPADGPGSFTITVRVTDNGTPALSATRTFAVAVNNVAPTAGIGGPATAAVGQAVTFTLTAADPSSADLAAGFTFAIDWNGDGAMDQTVTGPSGTQVSHVFTETGPQQVTVTATDKDDGVSEQAVAVLSVGGSTGGPGTAELVGTTLVVTGTDGDDVITVRRWHGSPTQLVVRINGVKVGTFTGVTDIVARSLAGNDRLVVGSNVTQNALLDGGDGNDFLQGGAGNDELLGQGGNDTLTATGGNDRLDGGDGDDLLRGGPGDDALLGGAGNDELRGGAGNDYLDGGAGFSDSLYGGAGEDVLIDPDGVAVASGGSGNDAMTLFFAPDWNLNGSTTLSGDAIDGDAGDDTLSLTVNNAAVRLDIYGSGGDDRVDLHGTWAKIRVYGGAGTDVVVDGGTGDLELHHVEVGP